MALSNRDRVGKMFELLAPPLDEFIGRSVAPKLKEHVANNLRGEAAIAKEARKAREEVQTRRNLKRNKNKNKDKEEGE